MLSYHLIDWEIIDWMIGTTLGSFNSVRHRRLNDTIEVTILFGHEWYWRGIRDNIKEKLESMHDL